MWVQQVAQVSILFEIIAPSSRNDATIKHMDLADRPGVEALLCEQLSQGIAAGTRRNGGGRSLRR